MEKIILRLKEICSNSEVQLSKVVYLKNAIKVGENKNGDITATYIDYHLNEFYGDDFITLNVILNERDCELYGKDYDFLSVSFKNENNFKPSFNQNNDITIYPNTLQLILNELESDKEWLDEVKTLKIKSNSYVRSVINRNKLTWEERMDRSYIISKMNFLMWRRPSDSDPDLRDLREMKKLGEVEYNKLSKRRNDILINIFNDV